MFSYLLKRLLLFIPTLIVASMLTFGLSRLTPSNQIVDYLRENPYALISSKNDLLQAEKEYRNTAKLLNLDKPAFYFSLTSKAFPDTLYKIQPPERRAILEKLIGQYGNWQQIETYFHSIRNLEIQILELPDSLIGAATEFKINLRELYSNYRDGAMMARLEKMKSELQKQVDLSRVLSTGFSDLKNNYENVKREATPAKLKTPSFQWHGFSNQYHHWLSNFITGDFGTSVNRRRPVSEIIGNALLWTLVLNLTALFLAFVIAIPLGIWSAVKKGECFDKTTTLLLFMLYSLPTFWIGTMLLIFFTTNEYGMEFFNGVWLGTLPPEASFLKK